MAKSKSVAISSAEAREYFNAGRAIIALKEGHLGYISMKKTRNKTDFCYCWEDEGALLKILVAGYVAQSIATGKPYEASRNTTWARADSRQAGKLAAEIARSGDPQVLIQFGSRTDKGILRNAEAEVAEYLRRIWRSVAYVSAGLHVWKKLRGKGVRNIIMDTLESPKK